MTIILIITLFDECFQIIAFNSIAVLNIANSISGSTNKKTLVDSQFKTKYTKRQVFVKK
jgi:hypothetical protein